MNDDNQIKHHLWWIIKSLGETGTYKEFIQRPLSPDICKDIDALVSHIKLTY